MKNYLTYFREISNIPRGSGNTDAISSYLEDFAHAHQLWVKRDGANNVIIRKPASRGCEGAEPLILQGHCDMVCEKKEGSGHDFQKDPLELQEEGEWLLAKDTSLGADDGIAVAYMLAILEDDSLMHPPLEAVFTTDEEIGMLGAAQLDYSLLSGRRMLNMDSEEEGILLVGCAGGMTGITRIPLQYAPVAANWIEVKISGLLGGHSGNEIHKSRANANLLAGRLLYRLDQELEFLLAGLQGGNKDNAIPRAVTLLLGMDEDQEDMVSRVLTLLEKELVREYAGSETGIHIRMEKVGFGSRPALKASSFQKVVFYLMNVPNGVIKMSGEIPGLVESSCNLGILQLRQTELYSCSSVRSSIGSAKNAISDRICYLSEFLGGTYTIEGAYPAWEYCPESNFRSLVETAYENIYQDKPKIEVIHAGLECGLFYDKLPGLECISLGPDIQDIHTTEERLSLPSAERTYRLVREIIQAAAH